MHTVLRELAENIVKHLECIEGGLPPAAHAQRLEYIALVEGILSETLAYEGFVQLVAPTGEPRMIPHRKHIERLVALLPPGE
jgi:hypothetical protein